MIEGLRKHVEIVLVVGMFVETLFLLLGLSYYNLFPPLTDAPAAPLSAAIVILGSFLTGIIVGFLLSDEKHAAAYGFLAAFIPSLFFSFLASQSIVAGPPLLVFIPFIILLFFDSLAAAGGAWASSIKTETFFVATVTILLLTSLIVSGGFFAMPTRQSDNLIVGANEVHYISGSYVQEANITVKDNATLVIQNCRFTSNQVNQRYMIETEDQGHLEIENSEFFVVARMYGGYHSSTIYIKDSASAIIKDSEIVSHAIVATQNAHFESIGSKYDYGSINAQDNSVAIITDSSVESAIHLSQNSSVYFSNSTNPYYICSDSAQLSIENSNNKANYIVTHGYIGCSGNCKINLTNSTIDGITADAFNGALISDNSLINETLRIQNGANFSLSGNLTISANVTEFFGYVTREYTILTNLSLPLNVTYQSTNRLIWQGQSDQNGFAAVEITFTSMNYTQQLSLNNQIVFNLTSTTPLILPFPK